MFITICDTMAQPIYLLDDYISLIWNEKYQSEGDFKLTISIDPATTYERFELLSALKIENLVKMSDSDWVMVIENFEVTTDSGSGPVVTISGRSIESYFRRRVLVGTYTNTQARLFFREMIEQNFGKYARTGGPGGVWPKERFLPIQVLNPLADTSAFSQAPDGSTVYDIVVRLCKELDWTFRIWQREGIPVHNHLQDIPEYSWPYYTNLIIPKDVSDNVIFSRRLENLDNTTRFVSVATRKTRALIADEGDLLADNSLVYYITSQGGSGLALRESFLRRDQNTTDFQLANNFAKENYRVNLFDGEVLQDSPSTSLFTYGTDYKLGDIVSVESSIDPVSGASNLIEKFRVSEFVRISDGEGYRAYPTFSRLEA